MITQDKHEQLETYLDYHGYQLERDPVHHWQLITPIYSYVDTDLSRLNLDDIDFDDNEVTPCQK